VGQADWQPVCRGPGPAPGVKTMTATAAEIELWSSRRRAYWTAWAATVTFFAGFYALLVPLPRYLAEVGLPDWQIGLVLGAFGVASLVGRPIAGVASDRVGPRRVMLVGAAALVVGAVGVVATTSLVPLFALRVLQATGYVAFTTAGTALIVALVPPGERGRRLAVFGAAANVAITITPALVAALLEVAPLEAGLLAAGGMALAAALLATRIDATAATTGRAIEWAVPRRLWLPMLIAALLGAAFAAFFQFAPILAERRGTVPVGRLYALYGVGIITTRLIGGRLLDRLAVGRVLVLSATLIAVGLGAIAATADPLWLTVAPLVIAAGSGLFHPALIAHHAALLPEAPGRATAAFYVGFDLGIGGGSWLLGFALEVAGLGGLYWTAAALAVAVVPLAWLLPSDGSGRAPL
jgi:predicted MFS family arabinose efflux permease